MASARQRGAPQPGSYAAVCVGVLDLGVQRGGPGRRARRQVAVRWAIDGGGDAAQGRVVSAVYPHSLAPKSPLRRMLGDWRGQYFTPGALAAFGLPDLLGTPCLLCLARRRQKGRASALVLAGVAPLPKGIPTPEARRRLWFSLDGTIALEQVPALPAQERAMVQKSRTYRRLLAGKMHAPGARRGGPPRCLR